MHPFGSFLVGRELLDRSRTSHDRALHRRPDAPPLPPAPLAAARPGRVRILMRRVLPGAAGA